MEGVSMYLNENTIRNVFMFIQKINKDSIFIMDIMHRCWLMSIGVYDKNNRQINAKYCQKHKMTEKTVNYKVYQNKIKDSPEQYLMSFDWNIDNFSDTRNTVSKKGKGYMHLVSILDEYNLNLYKYYGYNKLKNYIVNPLNNKTIIDVKKGYAIIILKP